MYLSIHPSICLSVCLSVYLSVHPSTCTSTCLSIYCCHLYCQEVIGEDKLCAVLCDHDPCVCLTVYLAIYLPVCLPVYLSVCLSLWSVMCLEVIGEDKLRVILHVCDPCVCLSHPSIATAAAIYSLEHGCAPILQCLGRLSLPPSVAQ